MKQEICKACAGTGCTRAWRLFPLVRRAWSLGREYNEIMRNTYKHINMIVFLIYTCLKLRGAFEGRCGSLNDAQPALHEQMPQVTGICFPELVGSKFAQSNKMEARIDKSP